MKHLLLIPVILGLSACQTTTAGVSSDEPKPLPPYPPGYVSAGGKVPELVLAALPAGVVPEQVLIADDGCYFYHVGATTYKIVGGEPKRSFCLQRDPVGTPIDLNAPLVIPAPETTG